VVIAELLNRARTRWQQGGAVSRERQRLAERGEEGVEMIPITR
jgi:hypothetical protein